MKHHLPAIPTFLFLCLCLQTAPVFSQGRFGPLFRAFSRAAESGAGSRALYQSSSALERGYYGARTGGNLLHLYPAESSVQLGSRYYGVYNQTTLPSLFERQRLDFVAPAYFSSEVEVATYNYSRLAKERTADLFAYFNNNGYRDKVDLYMNVVTSHNRRTTKHDSIMVLAFLVTMHPEINMARLATAAGGRGGGGNRSSLIKVAEAPEWGPGLNKSERKKEKENDDESDDDNDDDSDDDNDDDDSDNDNDNDDSDNDDVDQDLSDIGQREATHIDTGEKHDRSETQSKGWSLLWIIAILLHLAMADLGCARLSLKTHQQFSGLKIPVVRLGALFAMCGYAPSKAWWMLVPGINLYYWAALQFRLCRVFQYPVWQGGIGIIAPGLLWLLIGYSDRYYIGDRALD